MITATTSLGRSWQSICAGIPRRWAHDDPHGTDGRTRPRGAARRARVIDLNVLRGRRGSLPTARRNKEPHWQAAQLKLRFSRPPADKIDDGPRSRNFILIAGRFLGRK